MPQAELLYHGRAMRWEPTRILAIAFYGPLEKDEAPGVSIFNLLANELSVFVELQPGDGTRYGLLLSPGDGCAHVTRVGAASEGSLELTGEACTEADTRVLAPGNSWSRALLAWWLTELRRREMA